MLSIIEKVATGYSFMRKLLESHHEVVVYTNLDLGPQKMTGPKEFPQIEA